MDPVIILVILAIIAGFYLAFNIGANDVANAMGTGVGSRALTIKQAIVIAGVCEFLGALIFGDEVSKTISQGFISSELFLGDPRGFAYGMTAAILATSLWLQYATLRGIPVSTTHSIVGAVLGFALVYGGIHEVKYVKLLSVFFAWAVTPIIGGIISFGILKFILRKIIDTENPLKAVKIFAPWMVGFCVFILSSAFTSKIFAKFTNKYDVILGLIFSGFLGLGLGCFFYFYVAQKNMLAHDRKTNIILSERVFARMQMVTACFLAFAHGSNDVANAIGPAAAVIATLSQNAILEPDHIPTWLLLLGGIGIVLGLAILGRKVIETVGQSITKITPSRGFAAEFGAALTILVGTILGMPLSTTHVLVGCVIGVGFARGITGIDIKIIQRILRSWLITLPITALISGIFCFIIQGL